MLTFLSLLFGGNLKFQTLAARFGSCAPVEITPRHQRAFLFAIRMIFRIFTEG